jgi:SAM-dependent methyltransferase
VDADEPMTAVAPAPAGELPVAGRTPRRLVHVGCGVERLEGWINVDYELFPSVDVVADMRDPLPFRNVDAVFAEHFLEHLTLAGGLGFLASAHDALVPGGWLRLTTPNLDWVWVTQYKLDAAPPEARGHALALNRGFYAWGHRFLWNRSLLEEALASCGFDAVTVQPRGESAAPFLRGVERHEPYPDYGSLAHVVVVEARKGPARPERLRQLRQELWDGFWSLLEERDRGVGPGGVPLPRVAPAAAAPPRGPLRRLLGDLKRRVFSALG